MFVPLPVLAWTTLVLCLYLYKKLRQRRALYAKFPQLPGSLLWGHLRALDARIRSGKQDRHPDHVFLETYEHLGRPSMLLFDMWPVTTPLLVICNHEIAEELSKPSKTFPWSVTKWKTSDHFADLLGVRPMLWLEGEEWKQMRKKFNAGFSHKNLMTFLPAVLDKTVSCLDKLDHFSSSNQDFSLLELTTNLTFEVIAAVALGVGLESEQVKTLARLHMEALETFTHDDAYRPPWLSPRVTLKRRRLGRHINKLLNDIIIHTKSQAEDPDFKSNSLLAVRLREIDTLTPYLLDETRDQLKLFLVAGSDTTTITLAYAIYELSRSPRALAALRAELDAIFGPENTDPSSIREILSSSNAGDLMGKMHYVDAVIKETLRLHPPTGTSRLPPKGSNMIITDPATGQQHCIDGCLVYSCNPIIHRDPNIYGDSAGYFMPERWLTHSNNSSPGLDMDAASSGVGGKIPPSAWRPFERGPRSCLGQDLAILEARVVLALVARHFEFEKVGAGRVVVDEGGEAVVDEESGQFRVVPDLYNIMQITAKPRDMMRMKVKVAGKG